MRRIGFTLIGAAMGAWLLFAAPAWAQEREYFLPGPTVETYAMILSGPSPDETYGNQIREWSLRLYDILIKDYGYSPDHIILLMSGDDLTDTRISGAGRRDIIRDKMKGLEERVQTGDLLFFFLLGHGTGDEEEAKFVLTGPDISGGEFAAMLQPFSDQDIVVVNTVGSSFPFCTALTGEGRVIVSATRSRAEKYNTIFAQHIIAGLEGHKADRDKNRRVSVWEAFAFASRNVEKWYADQNRIPTEHPALEDSGDGIFSTDPGPDQEEGSLAQIAYLDPLLTARTAGDALSAGDRKLKLTLNSKIRELERSVFLLRRRKADLTESVYRQEMERLLIELARTSRQLRQMNGADRPSHRGGQ